MIILTQRIFARVFRPRSLPTRGMHTQSKANTSDPNRGRLQSRIGSVAKTPQNPAARKGGDDKEQEIKEKYFHNRGKMIVPRTLPNVAQGDFPVQLESGAPTPSHVVAPIETVTESHISGKCFDGGKKEGSGTG
ncbi:polyamine-transporting ATPase [Anopheles sinensis]|uniref:Polyamine-transporting ATPase n=1 Tax=Anopheles sinensis TaxID=74873 RepID=A0A084VKG1_ANOSI|nr:polyamine-transporting ATPase [Anopheles sinensis]